MSPDTPPAAGDAVVHLNDCPCPYKAERDQARAELARLANALTCAEVGRDQAREHLKAMTERRDDSDRQSNATINELADQRDILISQRDAATARAEAASRCASAFLRASISTVTTHLMTDLAVPARSSCLLVQSHLRDALAEFEELQETGWDDESDIQGYHYDDIANRIETFLAGTAKGGEKS